MTVLSAQTIAHRIGYGDLLIRPFEDQAKQALGMSYGLSSCGYDIRVGKIDRKKRKQRYASSNPDYNTWIDVESWPLQPGEFLLCASLEYMELPNDICGKVHDKSTLARQGLALQNTILEPGWRGYITLELSNHSAKSISIRVGQPIAQVVFELLDAPTVLPYVGKYQDQRDEPVPAILVADEVSGTFDATLAPGHTDLMVTPEEIDAFMEEYPLPEETDGRDFGEDDTWIHDSDMESR